jgi:hypothetical protein
MHVVVYDETGVNVVHVIVGLPKHVFATDKSYEHVRCYSQRSRRCPQNRNAIDRSRD